MNTFSPLWEMMVQLFYLSKIRCSLLVLSVSFTVSNCLFCPKYHFFLPSMSFCHRLLNCADMQHIIVTDDVIGEGAVKKVYKAFWHNQTVALNVLKEPKYAKDFLTGLNLLKLFQSSPFIVTLIGFCERKKMFVSEFHRFGDARNFPRIVENLLEDSTQIRLKFCLNYVQILEYIHSSGNGVRVMCDSNDLEKTLSQFLISENLQLVLNDVDALPSVIEEKKVRCGHHQIVSKFAAPEQLWPFMNVTYNQESMPKYDEKTDIWKVPNVCEHFLGDVGNHKFINYGLLEIHKQCKNLNPNRRPSATDIKQVYEALLINLSRHIEL